MANRYVAVVDDDEQVRRLLSKKLQESGIPTKQYECGEDLVNGLSSEVRITAVVMDTNMGSNRLGYDICRELGESHPHIPVIGASGNPEYMDNWLRSGAKHFFPKPFDFKELADLVKFYHPAV